MKQKEQKITQAEDKKRYYIAITGESGADTERLLSYNDYLLIKGIFDDCDSEYVGGEIVEIKFNYELYEELNLKAYKSLTYMDIKKLLTPYYSGCCLVYVATLCRNGIYS